MDLLVIYQKNFWDRAKQWYCFPCFSPPVDVCRKWLVKIYTTNNCPFTCHICIGRPYHLHCVHERTHHGSKWRCGQLNAKQSQQMAV
jgi:hypothetical protein